MLRSYLTLLLVLLMGRGYSQNDLLLFKKGRHTMATYAKGCYISFQLAGGQWIKGGWLFRVGGAGYAILDVVNGLIRNDFSFKKEKTSLAIAAGVFLFGVILQHTYKLTYRIGKRYKLETVKMH